MQEVAFALGTAIAVLDAVRDSGQVDEKDFGGCRRANLVLRERGRALRRGDVQAAGVRPALGRDHPRPIWRDGSEPAAISVRRAGQLTGADRDPAGEQRHAHPARDARGDLVARCARPGRPTSHLERGARVAATVGPAVVAADAAGARLRVRPAGVRRPVRRVDRSSRPRSPRSPPVPEPRSTACSPWAARSQPWSPATSSPRWCPRLPAAGPRSRRADIVVVGLNRFAETEPNPLLADIDAAIQTVDPAVEAAAISAVAGVAGGPGPGAGRRGVGRAS